MSLNNLLLKAQHAHLCVYIEYKHKDSIIYSYGHWHHKHTVRRYGVNCNCNYESNQQDAIIQVNLLFLVSSTCFGRKHRPKHIELTRNTPHNSHSSVSTHPRHQPAATWVNTTRYCKYSQVLLMMGENIARNMYSRLGIIN